MNDSRIVSLRVKWDGNKWTRTTIYDDGSQDRRTGQESDDDA